MTFLQVLQKQSELKSSPESSKDQIDLLSSVITDLNNSIKSVEKEIDRKQKDLKAAGKKWVDTIFTADITTLMIEKHRNKNWQRMSVGYTICTPENMTLYLRNTWILEKPGLNAFIFLVLPYDIHIYHYTFLHHSFFSDRLHFKAFFNKDFFIDCSSVPSTRFSNLLKFIYYFIKYQV